MFERIVAIVFPVFAIVVGGWLYGRRHKPDMAIANQLNMHVFLPTLVFAALGDKSFDIVANHVLAWASLIMVLGSGVVAWLIARLIAVAPKTFIPPMMFNNCGNLGLPLAVLAFGERALPLAVVMFAVSNLLHFTLGSWLLDRRVKWWTIWRIPVVAASFAGLAVSLADITIWQPLQLGIKMLGDVSVPLLLFSLGVRVADSPPSALRIGIIGALVRPLTGIAIMWCVALAFGLEGLPRAMLFIFGALPPAVLNYVFAERYHQEPALVASIVLVGNLAAVVIIPLVLAFVLV